MGSSPCAKISITDIPHKKSKEDGSCSIMQRYEVIDRQLLKLGVGFAKNQQQFKMAHSSSSDSSDLENRPGDDDERQVERAQAEGLRLRGAIANFDVQIGELLNQTADVLEAIHAMDTPEQARIYEASWRWARRQFAFRSRVRRMRRMGFSDRQADTAAYQAVIKAREERAARRRAQQGQQVGGAASRRDR